MSEWEDYKPATLSLAPMHSLFWPLSTYSSCLLSPGASLSSNRSVGFCLSCCLSFSQLLRRLKGFVCLFLFLQKRRKRKTKLKLSFEDNWNCLQWLLSYFWMFYSFFFMLLYFSVKSAEIPLLNQPNFLIIHHLTYHHQTMHWLMAFYSTQAHFHGLHTLHS